MDYTLNYVAADGTLSDGAGDTGTFSFNITVNFTTDTASGEIDTNTNYGGPTVFTNMSLFDADSATPEIIARVTNTDGSQTVFDLISPQQYATSPGQPIGVQAVLSTYGNPTIYDPYYTDSPSGYVQDVGLGSSGGMTVTQVPCFRRGTRILTQRGEVCVERLTLGDFVITASGETRPVKWLGRRRVNCARHPDPDRVWPIRIEAGAFGEGAPSRPLWLSPGHSVACGGSLIPIHVLTNGRNVAQFRVDSLEYWHVELDCHDILLADGLPAESFLDCGNRIGFANGGVYVEAHPDFTPRHWTETCLPLVQSGAAVVEAKMRLLATLAARGLTTTEDDDMHAWADGERIDPIRLGDSRFAFAFPPESTDIRLMSRTFTPAHTLADSSDVRTLGLCIQRLQIDGVDLQLDDASLNKAGWNTFERCPGQGGHRWTQGAARLLSNTQHVVLKLAGRGRYWQDSLAPNVDIADETRKIRLGAGTIG